MEDQVYHQGAGQVKPNTQNPQGNTANIVPVQQDALQSTDMQQVLGNQSSSIRVPVSSGSGTTTANNQPQLEAEGFSLLWLIVLAGVLLAAAHAYSLWRKRRKSRQNKAHIITETATTQPKNNKKKRQNKKKKKHHR